MLDANPKTAAPISSKFHKAPPHPPTKQGIVNKWLDREIYLRYETKEEIEILKRTFAIVVGDFLDIVKTSECNSWFLEDTVNMSLALLTDVRKPSNCFVLPTFDAHQLCSIGLGELEIDDSLLPLKMGLQDKSKRWIIVPCSDGMLSSHNEASDPTHDSRFEQLSEDGDIEPPMRETVAENPDISSRHLSVKGTEPVIEKETERKDHTSFAHGSHWGLMIIDTKKQVARWLDGLVDIKIRTKDGKKVASVAHMLNAGTAAGKILCGYDKLLGRERGNFTTSTLMWSPHQGEDNTFKGDSGACGPYMFACLKHIYENPQALEDLHAHFKKGSRASGNFCRGRKGFNSRNIRKEIQDMIYKEREDGKTEKDLSLGLTPQIIQILDLDTSVQQLVEALRNFNQANKTDNDEDLVMDHDSNDDPDHDLDEHLHDDLDYVQDIATYRARYLAAQKDGTCAAHGIKTLRQYVNHLAVQQSMMDAPKNNPNTEELPPVTKIVIDGIVHLIPNADREVFKPHITSKKHWPRNTKVLPDFAHLSKAALKSWLKANIDVSEHQEEQPNHTQATSKAMLHKKFKNTFLTEPDANFRTEWIHDRMVFTEPDEEMAASKIRHAIMAYYEPETLKLVKKYAQKKRTHEESHDGDDEKDAKKLKIDASLWIPMSDEELEKCLTDEIRNHENARPNKNNVTFRAILFVMNGGKFSKEPDENCLNLWINDPDVFVNETDFEVKDGVRHP